MHFKIKKRELLRNNNYSDSDVDIAHKFATEMHKEMGSILKSVVLYGSATKKKHRNVHDTDVLIILDDIQIFLTRDVMETYKILTEKIKNKISKKLHINTLRYSAFWEYVRNGDPIVVNMLRDGMPLLDSNLFEPMQLMLRQGRIRPTQESIWNYFSRSPTTLLNSKWHILQATIDLYWAVIDSAHAVLMKGGVTPPSPEHVADLLEERFVKTKILEKKYVTTMRKLYTLMKMITHREIKEIKGQQFDIYYNDAHRFVERMRVIIEGKRI